jgi:hypothetical protein
MGLFLDLFFGAVGSGYLIYGKKQYSAAFLVAGFILVIYPYFVSNMAVCFAIGVVVSAAPFFARHLES